MNVEVLRTHVKALSVYTEISQVLAEGLEMNAMTFSAYEKGRLKNLRSR